MWHGTVWVGRSLFIPYYKSPFVRLLSRDDELYVMETVYVKI